jgi:hypothetical protein
MEIKNIHEHAGWFASYMNATDGGNDAQGEALVKCQIKKIKQLTELIENIKGETELVDTSKEFSERTVLDSIKVMIEQIKEVEHTSGYFKWVG